MEEKFSKTLRPNKSFEDAIKALYSLQSNAAYLKLQAKQNPSRDFNKCSDTEKYLLRCGITLEKLDTLSVIHVAGTKGKGSTCAFTEAILRKHGFNTGFFSSPHLVSVRERIRINGQSISEQLFTQYFWKVYKKLEDAKEDKSDMPTYFKFLTILMFNIFLEANIDVAIIEVGIGGQKDCTNILKNPVCVGISSLALEHTSLLGNTLEDIAYQKSGIFKPKTVAFTVPQDPEAMRILEKRAIEKDCALYVIPRFEEYTWKYCKPALEEMCDVQRQNASLAIQMALEWIISKTNKKYSFPIRDAIPYRSEYGRNVSIPISKRHLELPESMDKIALGLFSCKWPGRTQILQSSVADFYLDGAHTIESMRSCISWFQDATNGCRGKRFLLFNTTGNRDSTSFLELLKSLNFDKAYFVPNSAGIQSIDGIENSCSFVEEARENCMKNSKIWGTNSMVGSSVLEALQDIKESCTETINYDDKPKILVTGSLHLIGALLTILDPNLTMSTKF